MAFAQRLRPEDGAASRPPGVDVVGWGCARLPSENIGELRRSLPAWAPPNTPNHFFKYADEQTLLAAQAVDDLLQRCDLDPAELATWGIIAAPQFLGRQVTAQTADQYSRAGAQRVSPHVVPQNSLHSVSGALSILLGTHGPNLGIGGSRDALTEGLLSSLTLFDFQSSSGCWLVATAWDPEPLPDRQGLSASPGVCHAVALAVGSPAGSRTRGQLSLSQPLQIFSSDPSPSVTVAELVSHLQNLDAGNSSQTFGWRLPWGVTLNLELTPRVAWARRAA